MADLSSRDQSGSPIPQLRTPRLACRWQKASDGALMMVWSLVEANPAALRVVSSKPMSEPSDHASADERVSAARPMHRARSVAERVAIAVLLGASGFLTWMSFVLEHNDLL
jgi:hypothetical protein